MRKGFEYFSKIFLINLDTRKDRLDRRYAFFKSQGVDDLVERYGAKDLMKENTKIISRMVK